MSNRNRRSLVSIPGSSDCSLEKMNVHRDPAIDRLYNKILQGVAALETPGLPIHDQFTIRQKLKLCYEELILGYPEFSANGRIITDYWERLWYPLLQGNVGTAKLSEARGSLAFLFHALSNNPPSPPIIRIQYDIIKYQGDLERYSGSNVSALDLYQRASEMIPQCGKAYNQLAIINSSGKESLALEYFLLSLTVQEPFSGARENFRKALKIFTGKRGLTGSSRLISYILTERLMSPSSSNHGKRKQLREAFVKERKSFKWSENTTSVEAAISWLTVIFDRGLLDTQELNFVAECFLRNLIIGLSQIVNLSLEQEHWVFPMIWACINIDLIPKTRRFTSFIDQIVKLAACYCNQIVGEVDISRSEVTKLPEDLQFIGIQIFASLKSVDYNHSEISHARSVRILAFAQVLQQAGLIFQDGNVWMSRSEYDRREKQNKTSVLLARKRLQEEVERLEGQALQKKLLESAPWLIPDTDYLLQYWSQIASALETKSARFLITFSVLAELDWEKNGSSSITARSIISRLSSLANTHDPTIRLQKMEERMVIEWRPLAVGPKDSHRRKFVEAVAYYSSNDKNFRVLTENDDTLALIGKYARQSG